MAFPGPIHQLREGKIHFPLLFPGPGSGATGHTFHVQKAVEVRECDTAIHRVTPVRKFVVCIEPGVKVFFTIFKLGKEEKRQNINVEKGQKSSSGNTSIGKHQKMTDQEVHSWFMTLQWSVAKEFRITKY